MGRKGVSKRKKAKVKEKVAPVSGGISAVFDRKADPQLVQAPEKDKSLAKGKKKR